MRYRIGEAPVEGAYASTNDFVTFTVWLTFVVGVIFIIAGYKGRQRWLLVWGVITLVACAIYALAIQLNWLS